MKAISNDERLNTNNQSNTRKIIKIKSPQIRLRDCIVRCNRITVEQLAKAENRRVNKINDNAATMKRKRVAANTLPDNLIKGAPTKSMNTKSHRTKKLTLSEKMKNEAPDNEFVIDEIILATIPGFCPWPARIIQIIGETITVEFFGTGQK